MKNVFPLILISGTLCLNAQEWTRFRGPNGTGVSETKGLPVRWTTGEYNWKIKLPGSGHSSPVLWGDVIFLNSADASTGEFVNAAIASADGRILWEKRYPMGRFVTHKFNSLASGTCAVEADRVYFVRQDGDHCFLVALTHEGKPVWELPLGSFQSQWGSGHSPMIYGDMVVLSYDHSEPGRVLAVDKATGKVRWEIPRSGGKADYSVPCVFEQRGQPPRLLMNTCEDGIYAVNPGDGTIAWKTDPVLSMRSVSSPAFADGVTFATCGSGAGGNYVVAIEPPAGGSGEARVKYEIRRSAPYVPAPLVYGDLAFLWSDGGIVTCIDPLTGEEHWRERVGGNYFSSPICVDGKLYNTSTDGKVTVLRAADRFEVLGRSDFDEQTHSTPAVANGRIYFRTLDHLISIGG